MSRHVHSIAILLVSLICCPVLALAQEAKVERPALRPKEFPAFDFMSLQVAKISADGTRLELLSPQLKVEQRPGMIQRKVPETRSRLVDLGNGVMKEETYTEYVNVMETFVVPVKTVQGETRTHVAIDASLLAWKIDGAPMEAAELAKLFEKPRHVVVLPALLNEKFSGVDPYYRTMLRDDLIVLGGSISSRNTALEGPSADEGPIPADSPPSLRSPRLFPAAPSG